MKIAIVSDIHTNVSALDAAFKEMSDVDEVFCAGDAVYGYRWSNPVYDLLRERGAHTVLGNHDRDFLQVHKDRNGSNGSITPENHTFAKELPWEYRIELGGRNIYMVHASPFEPYSEYVYPNTPKFQELGSVDADIFIYGHTHQAIAQRVGRVLVVNPGSAGEIRDRTRPFYTYAVIDLESLEVEIRDINLAGPVG